MIDSETSKIMFSPLFGDIVMYLLWEWTQNNDMHMCKHTILEAFPWITDKRYSKYLSHKRFSLTTFLQDHTFILCEHYVAMHL